MGGHCLAALHKESLWEAVGSASIEPQRCLHFSGRTTPTKALPIHAQSWAKGWAQPAQVAAVPREALRPTGVTRRARNLSVDPKDTLSSLGQG